MKHPLNFNWLFIKGFRDEYINKTPSEAEIVHIPHNMVDFPFNYFDEAILETLSDDEVEEVAAMAYEMATENINAYAKKLDI